MKDIFQMEISVINANIIVQNVQIALIVTNV